MKSTKKQTAPPGEGRLLRPDEAAAYLSLSPQTLAHLRIRGGGPPYIKISTAVRYSTEDLEQYVAARKRRSTSDPAAA